MIPFAHASIIMSCKSLMVALAAWLFNNESIPNGFIPASILCLVGVIVAMKLTIANLIQFDKQYWFGIILTLIGTLFVSLQPILVRKTRGLS